MKTENRFENKPEYRPAKEKGSNAGRNFFLVLLAGCALGAGYYAFDQHRENKQLEYSASVDRTKMQGDVLRSYQQIEQNLAEITAHEGVLRNSISSNNVHEGPLSPDQRVQQEIDIIEALIAHNNQLIEDMSRQLDDKDKELADYNKNINSLNKRIKEYRKQAEDLQKSNALLTEDLRQRELENADLNDEIRQKTSELDRQYYEIDQQRGTINAQYASMTEMDTELHTAYYIVGSYADLKEADVVEKEGGIIGIGATKNLKEDFEHGDFTTIDIRDYTIIPVYSKRADLVTTHPSDSYEWIEDDHGISWIKITDPDKFWADSKYLVVVTNNSSDLNSAERKTDVTK